MNAKSSTKPEAGPDGFVFPPLWLHTVLAPGLAARHVELELLRLCSLEAGSAELMPCTYHSGLDSPSGSKKS